MGTSRRNHGRRRPARARGLATSVAFMLLFALALGQGSSLTAFADDGLDASQLSASTTSEADGSDAGAPAVDDGAAEAPAEEGSGAAEAPADEGSGAAEAPADEGSADGGAGGGAVGGGAAAASPDGGERKARGTETEGRTNALAAPTPTSLEGGDIDLDFIAAGPFTYDHTTGLGDYPDFGYNDRTIDKDHGVVESLESGDFECDDLVTFFTEITVDDGAATSGTIELDFAFGAETTGQPGLGFTDIVSWGINTPDDGNVGNVGDNVVTLSNEHLDTQGYDEIKGTFTITNLAAGEVAILRITVQLECFVGSPTGNILSSIPAGRVVSPEEDTIPVGQQTVPMKTTGFVAEPAIDITKFCPEASAFGEDITYEITITNTGNEELDITSVLDTVNGNVPEDITSLFPDTIMPGESELAEFVYSPDGTEPDPLPNTVEVEAEGVVSQTVLTDSAGCQTDITHEPGIDVEKSCPAQVPVGEDVVFTITLVNTGNEPLEDVVVTDDLLGGDITDAFDLPDPLPVGDTEYSEDFTYTPGADEDPVENSVTASGVGADSGDEATDTSGCQTDITHEPAIDVTKSCAEFAHEGDTVTYTITVENVGTDVLEDVTVIDTVLGDLSGSFADTLDPGVSETHLFDHVIPEDGDDPLVNVVTAEAVGADSEAPVSDVDSCSTDILNPAIEIVKEVSEETVPVGTTVTYSYKVTNTGDTTLYDISVDDDIMGHIGDIEVLEPEQSVTLTKDFVVGEDVVINVGTATGTDILGRSVSADDDAIVTPIAGQNPPPPTPFTGSDAGRLGLISIALLGIGVTVVAATRRRRTEAEAA